MLGFRLPILASEIDRITVISLQHNVFLITGENEESFVVKREAHGTSSMLRNVNRVMRAVDPTSKFKPLTKQDLIEIKNFLQQLAMDHSQDPTYVSQLTATFAANVGVWTKMDFHDLTNADEAMKAVQASQDKTGVRAIAAILNGSNGLEHLGEILAADAFSGNIDRFNIEFPIPAGREGCTWETASNPSQRSESNFWCLQNIGNVLFTKGPTGRPIGLDAFDPTSTFTDWNQSVTPQFDNDPHWPGRLLAPTEAHSRAVFCHRVVEDLNDVLGERNRRLPVFSKVRLQKNAAQRLLNGMNMGINKIRERLTTKYYNKLMPAGLIDRFNKLNWPLPQQAPPMSQTTTWTRPNY